MTPNQKILFDAFNAFGRLAILYLCKRRISISGGKAIPIEDAMKKMRQALERDKEKTLASST